MTRSHTLVFVGASVDFPEILIAGLDPKARLHRLSLDGDPLAEIARIASRSAPLRRVAILTHGSPGHLVLSGRRIGRRDLEAATGALEDIGNSLSAAGEVVLVACSTGRGRAGRAFVAALEDALGVPVQASETDLGADAGWGGLPGAAAMFTCSARAAYPARLGVFNGDGTDNTLVGTNDPDTIKGNGGNDVISGLAGDDELSGGTGDDTISGGAGNDTVSGMGGNDVIYGMDGDDLIGTGNGNDLVSGGAGNDSIYVQGGNDTVSGGAGNDVISTGDGGDVLYGGTAMTRSSWREAPRSTAAPAMTPSPGRTYRTRFGAMTATTGFPAGAASTFSGAVPATTHCPAARRRTISPAATATMFWLAVTVPTSSSEVRAMTPTRGPSLN